MIEGVDLLASACFPGQLAYFSKQYAVGVFAEEFQDAYPAVVKACQAGAFLIRIHLIWHADHKYGKKDILAIERLARLYNSLAIAYPKTHIQLSPFCEQENTTDPDIYLDICQACAPHCQIINSVAGPGKLSKKYRNEVHGDHYVPIGYDYQYSFDGTDSTTSHVKQYELKYKDAIIFFLWTPVFNLKYSMKDPASTSTRIKEAKKRKPTKDYIQHVVNLYA